MKSMDFNFEVKLRSAYEALVQSVSLFRLYLDDRTAASSPEYYRAKSLLKEGKLFFEEVMKEARKLLGPLPPYSTPEYAKWREETARDLKLALGDRIDYEEVKKVLLSDACLPRLFSAEELESYLQKYFEHQGKGKRKMENLKCRLAIARLSDLIREGEELLQKAQKKLQSTLL
ncbi:MAG: hypothetical protein NUW07_08995 [Candidatus Saccharicenans sp.]|nr:hypothetical protein [Candidatus Saccharicenans sp.]MDH7493586.1 hypothetical protein [Candidatus Saccharicenans sp.]